MNTWPGGRRRAMTQSEHEAWNARNFPGTRQLCEQCGEPTGRCEDDSLYADEDGEIGPLCEECWHSANAVFEGPASKHGIEDSSSTRSISKNFVMPQGGTYENGLFSNKPEG